jgi:hypothetical protein
MIWLAGVIALSPNQTSCRNLETHTELGLDAWPNLKLAGKDKQ